MYHIFESGVPEGLHSMEAHMKALASVDESAETVLRRCRILELAAEEDEANSVVFPGGVLHEDNNSVPEWRFAIWVWDVFRRWFFMVGCEVAVLLAWVKVAVFWVLGSLVSGRARTVVTTNVGVRDTVATDVGPRYFDVTRVGQVHSTGQGKGGGMAGFHGQGVGAGMSGVRLVGALWAGSDVCFDWESFIQPWLWRESGEVPGRVSA